MSSLLSSGKMGRRQMRPLYSFGRTESRKSSPRISGTDQTRVHLLGHRLCQRGVEANGALVESEKLSQCQTPKHFTVQSHIMKQHGTDLSRK